MNILKNIKFFYHWYKRNFTSPSPNFVEHKIIENYLIKDSIFIEYKDKELTLFLDGHYSGKDTYKGTSDTLIKYELDLLSKFIKDF